MSGRVVVKVGSSSLTAADGGLDVALVRQLVEQVAALVGAGRQLVLVSSGAVAAGLRPLGLTRRPDDLPRLQAAASVGQGILVHAYARAFAEHGVAVGQVLLTPDDVVDRQRYLNARHTFDMLLSLRAVPVVNENDTVATDALRFSDNDRLAALVASMLGAKLLVLLTDVEGLHDGDPAAGAPLVRVVHDVDRLDERHHGAPASGLGRGGMASKLEAVRIAAYSGVDSVIAAARAPGVVTAAVAGETVGTRFPAGKPRPEARKLWIAFAHRPTGTIHVDAGAARALVDRGSSLLAIGVTAVEGEFAAGAAVDVRGPDGLLVGRGLVAFDSAAVRAMAGRRGADLAAALGPGHSRAVVHRDHLAVTARRCDAGP